MPRNSLLLLFATCCYGSSLRQLDWFNGPSFPGDAAGACWQRHEADACRPHCPWFESTPGCALANHTLASHLPPLALANGSAPMRIWLFGDSNQRRMAEAVNNCLWGRSLGPAIKVTFHSAMLIGPYVRGEPRTLLHNHGHPDVVLEGDAPPTVIFVHSAFWSLLYLDAFCGDCRAIQKNDSALDGTPCNELCPTDFAYQHQNQRLPPAFLRLHHSRAEAFLEDIKMMLGDSNVTFVFGTAPIPKASPPSAVRYDRWIASLSVGTYVAQLNDIWRELYEHERSRGHAALLDMERLFRAVPFDVSHFDDMHLCPDAQLAAFGALVEAVIACNKSPVT